MTTISCPFIKITRIIIALLAILQCTCLSAQYVQGDPSSNRISAEEFAILPWGVSDGDERMFREIYDCGFNLAGFVPPKCLDDVKKAGLKALVYDGSIHGSDETISLSRDEITSRVKHIASLTAKHPATYGYYIRDEPAVPAFEMLGRWSDAVREFAPDSLPYINLFPNYANMPQLGATSYEDYIDQFVAKTRPKFLSYDHYALMDDGTLRGGYYQNLEAMRAAGMRHKLPFWNIVLGNAHFTYAEPTPAGLRFQAYTTLAYGARGISYFTYFAPTIGNYRLAAIDQFGNRTPTWDNVRNVNLQIHHLAPTLVKLKSVNVFHHPEVPEGCKGIDTSSHIESVNGGDYLVGEFEDEAGKPYAMVVNKSLHNSTAFGIKFKSDGDIMMINSYTGKPGPWTGENIWLAAGQGMLLTIQHK